jgi:threonine-phosphate decarboxylase
MVEVFNGRSPQDIVVRLEEQGVLVRDCQTFSGMTKTALRFAVRLRRENQRLVQILNKALQEYSGKSVVVG